MSTQHLSPIERASNRWWKVDLPEIEDAKHVRLMEAIRRIDPKPVRIKNEPRDWQKWRKARNQFLKDMLRPNCRVCLGTGEITVDDGYGGVDFDECYRCSWFEPYADDYPTIGDKAEVAF